jgi:hypothetical protein
MALLRNLFIARPILQESQPGLGLAHLSAAASAKRGRPTASAERG